MKFDSGSLWYLENENSSTTESWTDENFDLKNPRYERKKKSNILQIDPFARLGPSYWSVRKSARWKGSSFCDLKKDLWFEGIYLIFGTFDFFVFWHG